MERVLEMNREPKITILGNSKTKSTTFVTGDTVKFSSLTKGYLGVA